MGASTSHLNWGHEQCQPQACHITDIAAWLQLEEEIQADLKWCMTVEKVLHSGRSDFQSVELIESGPFGKVGDMQGGRAAFQTMDGGLFFALPACKAAAVHTIRCTLGVCHFDMCNAAGFCLQRLLLTARWAALKFPQPAGLLQCRYCTDGLLCDHLRCSRNWCSQPWLPSATRAAVCSSLYALLQ